MVLLIIARSKYHTLLENVTSGENLDLTAVVSLSVNIHRTLDTPAKYDKGRNKDAIGVEV